MADEIAKLMDRLKKDGIRFVRFEAPTNSGQAIGMLVPARNCEHFLRKGFPFCTFACMQTINTGMDLDNDRIKTTGYRNVMSFPDVSSYRVIPWKQNIAPTASIMVSQAAKYDSVYPTDSRTLCSRQIAKLNSVFGYDILSSIEHEFSLLDADGKAVSGPGCYHLQRISKFTDFFAKVDENFYKMGIECDRLHSEVASGQYEITALPAFNLDGADHAYWIKNGVREMAEQYKQWQATFMTHLYGDGFSVVEDDSGAHFNFSLFRKGANVLWDPKRNDLSDTALYFIGGILKHIDAVSAFCCPTVICYATRFKSPWVSSQANWGKYNRTALIRAKPSQDNTHFEFRLPSSLSNPYLVLAAVICAGCDGLKNKIMPPRETTIEMVDERERKLCCSRQVPKSLDAALLGLKNDQVFAENLDSFYVQQYILCKTMEIQEMKQCNKESIKPLCYSLL